MKRHASPAGIRFSSVQSENNASILQRKSTKDEIDTYNLRKVEKIISSSRLETTLLSSAGDVLVCRSREVFPVFQRAADSDHHEKEARARNVSTHHSEIRRSVVKPMPTKAVSERKIRVGLLGGSEEPMPRHLEDKPYCWGKSQSSRNCLDSASDHFYRDRSDDAFRSLAKSQPIEPEKSIKYLDTDKKNFLSTPVPSFDYDDPATPTSGPSGSRSPLRHITKDFNNKLSMQSQTRKATEHILCNQPLIKSSSIVNHYQFAYQQKPITRQSFSNVAQHQRRIDDANEQSTSKEQTKKSKPQQQQVFFHGTPTCLDHLSQIKITKVSAHPLGSHVLLISREALLFSYGQNIHGQLGQEKPSRSNSNKKFSDFISKPTIVVPLLENGGKTIDCAAGINNSLVVVKTEGKRIGRLQRKKNNMIRQTGKSLSGKPVTRVISSPYRIHGVADDDDIENETTWHHQLYGFGKNDFMKLGLVNPIVDSKHTTQKDGNGVPKQVIHGEDVPLPRRAALHCQVWPDHEPTTSSNSPPFGIISIATSEFHSAALVHRPNGAMEVYTWGRVEDGALGLSMSGSIFSNSNMAKNESQSSSTVPIPTCIQWLTYHTSVFCTQNSISNCLSFSSSSTSKKPPRSPAKKVLKLCDGYATGIFLGPSCTFVVLSSGKCISFGTSYDGMLGLGVDVNKAFQPTEIKFLHGINVHLESNVRVATLSVGARHVVAVTQTGDAFGWGVSNNGRLNFGDDSFDDKPEYVIKPSLYINTLQGEEDIINWNPRQIVFGDDPETKVQLSKKNDPSIPLMPPSISGKDFRSPRCKLKKEIRPLSLRCNDPKSNSSSACGRKMKKEIAYAHAGFDNTFFILKSGHVLSCGRKSGRLGQGEASEDRTLPSTLFGSFRLWYKQ